MQYVLASEVIQTKSYDLPKITIFPITAYGLMTFVAIGVAANFDRVIKPRQSVLGVQLSVQTSSTSPWEAIELLDGIRSHDNTKL